MIMSLSMKLYCHTGGQPQEFEGRAAEASQNFCHAAEAALVVGEFTKKIYYHYHTLRTLFLMCAGRNHQEQADHTWLLLGWVTRIAMSMGLHRDPEQYKLSPFEIEIRRRLWTQLVCMDLLHSIQSGLPSMMRDGDYDAKEPANLHDHEIGHHLTEQPVPNDLEVMTGVSYMICKSRLSRSYGKIVTQANSTKNRIPYDEVLRLDSELRTAFATLPSFLLYSEARDDSNDPLFLILQRYSLECLFLKAMITLHRPWSCKALDIPRYTPSRTACVKCCTKLLDHQYEIFGEVKGPRLRPISWFIQNTASYDFIHSVIILAIDLWQAWKHKKLEEENDMEYIGTKAKIATLQRTKKIYESAEMIRDECQKALGIIALVLNKIATPYEDSAAKSNGIAPAPDVCQKVARAAPPNSAASGSDLKPNTPFTPYSSSILSRGTTPLSPDSMNTLSTLASNFIDRQQTQTPGGSMVMAEAQANNPISLTPGSNPLQNTFFIPTSPPMFTQFAGLSPVPSTRQVYNDPNYYPGALDWVSTKSSISLTALLELTYKTTE